MKITKLLVSIFVILSFALAACATPSTETPMSPMETDDSMGMATETETPMETDMSSMETQEPTEDDMSTEEPMTSSEPVEVEIEDFLYEPASLTVKVGTTVTWTNKDNVRHTVTSDTGVFDSGLFGKDASFSFTFTEAGVFPYLCTPHPYMVASVTVVE